MVTFVRIFERSCQCQHFRMEALRFLGNMTSCTSCFINSERGKKAGEGTVVNSCYNVSDNMNLFPGYSTRLTGTIPG